MTPLGSLGRDQSTTALLLVTLCTLAYIGALGTARKSVENIFLHRQVFLLAQR